MVYKCNTNCSYMIYVVFIVDNLKVQVAINMHSHIGRCNITALYETYTPYNLPTTCTHT